MFSLNSRGTIWLLLFRRGMFQPPQRQPSASLRKTREIPVLHAQNLTVKSIQHIPGEHALLFARDPIPLPTESLTSFNIPHFYLPLHLSGEQIVHLQKSLTGQRICVTYTLRTLVIEKIKRLYNATEPVSLWPGESVNLANEWPQPLAFQLKIRLNGLEYRLQNSATRSDQKAILLNLVKQFPETKQSTHLLKELSG